VVLRGPPVFAFGIRGITIVGTDGDNNIAHIKGAHITNVDLGLLALNSGDTFTISNGSFNVVIEDSFMQARIPIFGQGLDGGRPKTLVSRVDVKQCTLRPTDSAVFVFDLYEGNDSGSKMQMMLEDCDIEGGAIGGLRVVGGSRGNYDNIDAGGGSLGSKGRNRIVGTGLGGVSGRPPHDVMTRDREFPSFGIPFFDDGIIFAKHCFWGLDEKGKARDPIFLVLNNDLTIKLGDFSDNFSFKPVLKKDPIGGAGYGAASLYQNQSADESWEMELQE